MSDFDVPQLSAETLTALQEFYAEREAQELQESGLNLSGQQEGLPNLEENWQLSQFWYTDETAELLGKEAVRIAGANGRIACISCPTLYKKLKELETSNCNIKLFEFDKRFSAYGDDFVFYDYNHPLEIPDQYQGTFDVALADPPFLSEECLTKTASTIKHLTKGTIILCTGAVMEELAAKLLNVHLCKYEPRHVRNLGNIFRCYANYDLDNFIYKN